MVTKPNCFRIWRKRFTARGIEQSPLPRTTSNMPKPHDGPSDISRPIAASGRRKRDPVNPERCPRLKIESEIIQVSGAGVELRVPIRRCLLGEQMARLLMQTEEGRMVCARLLINSPDVLEAPDLQETEDEKRPVRVAYGPDLEPIHPMECMVDRCVESCSPSYKAMLLEFGLHNAVTVQEGKGCYEIISRE